MTATLQHRLHPTIMREYDIRGIVGETLHEADAHAIGLGFASLVREGGGGRVAVSADCRLSSPALAAALMGGLQQGGMEVISIGMGPTPLLYCTDRMLEMDGAIQITGSHNPPGHNGFKMVLGGKPFFGAAIRNLGRLLEAGVTEAGGGRQTPPPFNMQTKWIETLLEKTGDLSTIKDKTILWDCGNGAMGPAVMELLPRLAGRHIPLFAEPDGRFPNHHPDPADPATLGLLREAMRENNAALGIGFDGDGDRIGLMDKHGNMVAGDIITAYLARDILRKKRGAEILFDIKSSAAAMAAVEAAGGIPSLWKTGHSHMKTRMAETGAALAGEMSGHIFMRLHENGGGVDDALFAALAVLRAWHKSGESIGDFARGLPPVFASDEHRIPCDDDKKFAIMESITADVLANPEPDEGKPLTMDGLRIPTGDGWWLLRASNTGGYLVARCEGSTAARRDALLSRITTRLNRAGIIFPPPG